MAWLICRFLAKRHDLGGCYAGLVFTAGGIGGVYQLAYFFSKDNVGVADQAAMRLRHDAKIDVLIYTET
ncbi:MAG: hypothetical protein ISR72_03930 [Methylobacter sp.]|nr:hypothetical protein [Methylobacter sp.]